MRILITGGAGFIGSNIAKKLYDQGHSITILDDLSTGYAENLQEIEHTFVKGTVTDRKLVENVVAGKDAVFHLAASVGNIKSIERTEEDLLTNYGGTLSVLEAIRKHQVPKLIYSSTAAGYGEPVQLPVPEDHPLNPDSPYGVSKIAAEKLALCYGKLYQFQVTCLRYFNAYGVNQRYDAYGNVIPTFAYRIRRGEPLFIYGDGEQTRDFVNVEDIVRANELALNSSVSGYFNIASGVKTSIKKLVSDLKEVTGLRFEVIHKPSRKGEVLHSYADVAKAAEHLKYEAGVTLKNGLNQYWQWMKTLDITQ